MIVEKEIKLDEKLPRDGEQVNLESYTDLRFQPQELTMVVTHTLIDDDAGTGTKYGTFFVAPFPCTLIRAHHRHALSSAANCEIQIQKNANGGFSGVDTLQSNFQLDDTGSTAQEIDAVRTEDARFEKGDAASLVIDAGTPTNATHAVFTLVFTVQSKYLA